MSKAKGKKLAMPAFVDPCLATLVTDTPSSKEWGHEIKFDGYRLQARIENGNVQLLTRSGQDWTDKFGALPKSLLTLKLVSAIIDGEVVVEDAHGASSFVELVSDLKARRSARMVYFAFDLLFLDGADVSALPLSARKSLLKRVMGRCKCGGQIRFADHLKGNGPKMLSEACKIGLEGIISKRLDKPYRSGRGTDWVKSKCIQSDEFVVAGYLESNAAKNAVGALVVGFYEGGKFIYAGRVGTGFNRRSASELWQNFQVLRVSKPFFAKSLDATQSKLVIWLKPKLVAQVEYGAWTGDGLLRHASFKALRDDKSADQVGRPSTSR